LLYVQPRWFPTWLSLIAASCVVVVGVLVVHPAGDGRRVAEYARGALSALPQEASSAAQSLWAQRPRAILPDLPSAKDAQAVAPSVPGTGERAAPMAVPAPIITPLPVEPDPSDATDGAPIEGESAAAAAEPAQQAEDTPAVALDESAAAAGEPAEEASKPTTTRRRVVGKRPVRIGGLRLNAKPWAEVYVDGKRVGNTPQTHLELSAGRHRITLQNEEYDLRKTFSVDIEAGVTKTRIIDLLAAPSS
jgi:serine/threonine-protein kinase